jgi:SAM-dependent methyltransferase
MPDASHDEREIEFFDRFEGEIGLDDNDVETFFTAPAALENKYILARLGNVSGKNVLDVGGGGGEAAINFARLGAMVECCDISPGSIRRANGLAEKYGVVINARESSATALAYPDTSFDFVYMNGVLHHVSDREKAYAEIFRVLRPGGHFFAIEPLVGSPPMWIYRLMTAKTHSEGEAPLTLGELLAIRRFFPECGSKCFWLLTQSLFMKYYLVDGIHPNDSRYYRRIYRESDRDLRWWRPLKTINSLLTSLPLLRRWSYTSVFLGKKP